MRHVAILIVLLLCSCAAKVPKVKVTSLPVGPDGHPLDVSLALIGDGGLGHGCPVGGFIYTAKHLLRPRNPLAEGMVEWVTWSDREGNNGRATLLSVDAARDLAVLRIVSGQPALVLSFALGLAPGERVHWFEYDWSSKERAFEPDLRWARVMGLNVAQYIRMSEEPAAGASGGCLLNNAGDVVGIVVWGIALENRDVMGMAVSLIEDKEVH